MKHYFLVAAALGLSACNTVPDAVDLDTEVGGNYQALADCVYVDFTDRTFPMMVIKVELPSQSLSRLQIGANSSIIGELDFIDQGDTRTRVTLRHQRAIYGKDFYADRYMKSIDRCAAQLG
tara:strand:+ start:24122 stop:24484 length:363 start_codon:yes stop_codon:yes gene_type:complete